MNRLKTRYMGLELASPIVASASPLTGSVESIVNLARSGASAVVMNSLFEEQVLHEQALFEHYHTYGSESFGEALNFFPQPPDLRTVSEEYLHVLSEASRQVDIPVIGSLNGTTTGGWIDYATQMQEAGASAIELNTYFLSTDPEVTATEVEENYLDVVRAVKAAVNIPVAVKLSPFFSSLPNMARRLTEDGMADALVLFNRFYQPDLDLDNLQVVPHLVLSRSHDMNLPMTWIAILYGQIKADMAITSGIHTHTDIIKAMMAGAAVTQMASALLQDGTAQIRSLQDSLTTWLDEHDYESLQQLKGSMSRKHVGNPAAFERVNYMRMLHSWSPDPTGVNV